MACNPLVKDSHKYVGKYVATRGLNDNTVVASGKDPIKVSEAAAAKGFGDGLVIFVPPKGAVHIY